MTYLLEKYPELREVVHTAVKAELHKHGPETHLFLTNTSDIKFQTSNALLIAQAKQYMADLMNSISSYKPCVNVRDKVDAFSGYAEGIIIKQIETTDPEGDITKMTVVLSVDVLRWT